MPKVVEADGDAEVAQLVEVALGVVDGVGDDPLRDLELEHARRQVVLAQPATDDARQVRAGEVGGGDVDGHGDGHPRVAPAGDLREGQADDALGEHGMMPDPSARGMNSSGGTKPRTGWCQRTSASTPIGAPSAVATLGW